MVFNSYIFIFLLLPLSLLSYFIFNKFKFYKSAKISLLCFSLWFYGYFNYHYLFIILLSIIFNFYISKFTYSNKKNLILGLVVNLSIIFVFKYYDFFIDNINFVFKQDLNYLRLIMPLGISFFTFQQISYLVDNYKCSTNYSLIDYSLYISFFPQLVAGPIVLHNEFIPQLNNINIKKSDCKNLYIGLYKISIGLFKKVIIADNIGVIVNVIYNLGYDDLSFFTSLVAILSYTIQIYCDFSGYSDIAIGIGNLFNFNLPINFNSPYQSTSIVEFWSRWHISLSNFLKKYVYIPLGGNSKGTRRTCINIILVFLLSGFWHGANWTFILWGLLHGIGNTFNKLTHTKFTKVPLCLKWALTFTFINITFVFFRSPNIETAINILRGLFNFDFIFSNSFIYKIGYELYPIISNLGNIIRLSTGLVVLGFFILLFTIVIASLLLIKNIHVYDIEPTYLNMATIIFCLTLSIISFSRMSTFLYFNF